MRAWAPPPWAGLTQPADTHAFSSTGDTFATWLLQTPKLARLFVDHIYLHIYLDLDLHNPQRPDKWTVITVMIDALRLRPPLTGMAQKSYLLASLHARAPLCFCANHSAIRLLLLTASTPTPDLPRS